MIVGSVSENKNFEKRISITPDIVKKYINLGADGIFVTGIQSKKDLFELGKITKKVPLMLNITQNISFDMSDVKKIGFKNVKVYLGSWGEWGNRSDLPLQN